MLLVGLKEGGCEDGSDSDGVSSGSSGSGGNSQVVVAVVYT